MSFERNFLEILTFTLCSSTLICILINYVVNISPLTGIWFVIYILVVFFLSVSSACKFVRWFMNLNKPVKYDDDELVQKFPFFVDYLTNMLPRVPDQAVQESKEYDTNELSVISTVLERKLVSSWYTHYVSQEIGFPFACKQMLDQMIGRTFQICNKIDSKDVYVDICSVLITHLKEFKKALKRHEKSPNEPIESLYKKSHPIFTSEGKLQPAEHCANLLRVVLKELVPWEIWDTPQSELLVQILAKKLDSYIDNTIADPVWLNDKLMTILKGKNTEQTKEEKPQEKQSNAQEVITENQPLLEETVQNDFETEATVTPDTTIESALSTLVTTTAPILQNAVREDFNADDVKNIDTTAEDAMIGSQPVDITASPVLRQRRGRQGRNSDVKIYDRIIEGSVKTWESRSDLQCISLGQDLLAGFEGDITFSRLWGQDPLDDGKQETKFPFGDDDGIDMELDSKEPSPVKKEPSPKPTDALLKDLQTTVHQAKTKIGDLQVPNVIDVPNNDEAAGMMEGLLDFGIAGLKKGLRFTGLDSQDKSPSHKEKEKLAEKSLPPDGNKHKLVEVRKIEEDKEIGISSIIQKEDNGSSVPPLVKQQRVLSQDSVASLPRPIPSQSPLPLPLPPLSDSPEPEYEEAADLSTSIAKLRCLLQQRAESGNTSTSSKSEDIWWEPAEETRGKTQQHHSSRPVDTATFADEYDITAIEKDSPTNTTNSMQKLDRLFQRTVTGVFNSIKTAVGAEGDEGALAPMHDWTYVCTSVELSVGGAVARLVGSRRAYNHVDAALDSLEQLSVRAEPAKEQLVPDDYEEWCMSAGAGWCATTELLAAAGLVTTHLAVRSANIVLADIAESFLSFYLSELTSWLRTQTFTLFEQLAEQEDTPTHTKPLRKFDVKETREAILENIHLHPYLSVCMGLMFGRAAVASSVDVVVSSVAHNTINRDVAYRALDLCVLRLHGAAAIRNTDG